MNRALITILVIILGALVLLILTFLGIGGVFNKIFWLNFLPDLISDLIILLVVLFIVNKIFQKERLGKLKEINAVKSKLVLFLSNRLAFWLLEYLGLTKKQDLEKDKELMFEFAIAKLKNRNLKKVFFGKLMESDNKQNFVDGFVKKLKIGTDSLSKTLDEIYPHSDPLVKKLLDEMIYSNGTLNAIKEILKEISEINKKVKPSEQAGPEFVNLLMKIMVNFDPHNSLEKISSNLIEISQKAKANQLFVLLD